jgi:hypothetical protein
MKLPSVANMDAIKRLAPSGLGDTSPLPNRRKSELRERCYSRLNLKKTG